MERLEIVTMTDIEKVKAKQEESKRFRAYMQVVTEHMKKNKEEARKLLVKSGLYKADGTLAEPYK